MIYEKEFGGISLYTKGQFYHPKEKQKPQIDFCGFRDITGCLNTKCVKAFCYDK